MRLASRQKILLSIDKRTEHRTHVDIYSARIVLLDGLALTVTVINNLFNSFPLDKMAAILADDTLKCIFLKGNDRIPIQFSLKFVLKGPIDNNPALVQIMAWRRTGDKPLSEPMLTRFTDGYMRH